MFSTRVPMCKLYNQGINSRFYHGFQCEDHVGRLCDALCISQKQGLENAALQKWYVGFLGFHLTGMFPYFFVLFLADPNFQSPCPSGSTQGSLDKANLAENRTNV